MQRYASVELRARVDRAVGPVYDRIFLQLDLLLTRQQGRCCCPACRADFDRSLADLRDALPPAP